MLPLLFVLLIEVLSTDKLRGGLLDRGEPETTPETVPNFSRVTGVLLLLLVALILLLAVGEGNRARELVRNAREVPDAEVGILLEDLLVWRGGLVPEMVPERVVGEVGVE